MRLAVAEFALEPPTIGPVADPTPVGLPGPDVALVKEEAVHIGYGAVYEAAVAPLACEVPATGHLVPALAVALAPAKVAEIHGSTGPLEDAGAMGQAIADLSRVAVAVVVADRFRLDGCGKARDRDGQAECGG